MIPNFNPEAPSTVPTYPADKPNPSPKSRSPSISPLSASDFENLRPLPLLERFERKYNKKRNSDDDLSPDLVPIEYVAQIAIESIAEHKEQKKSPRVVRQNRKFTWSEEHTDPKNISNQFFESRRQRLAAAEKI